ncbi:unnamed protein product [Brassica rapa subsp. trilocularis]
MKRPYCSSTQGQCATTSSGRSITECSSCGRVVEERQTQNHHLFHLRAQDTPLPLNCSQCTAEGDWEELATHIGEVVINKCFCTRRNPISISAAAIYLACQLEDKRKTQAEICKITGLTEVTLRKLYKELLRELGRSSPV